MRYKGFYIQIRFKKVRRKNPDGITVDCDGFLIEIFDGTNQNAVIDFFTAAVGFELLKNSLAEAEQLAKDYINLEEKELCRLLKEYHSFEE